jgi:spore coat protein U-like protein
MSKRLIIVTMIVLALGFVGTAKADQDHQDFAVTANVPAACTVDSASDVEFGAYANSAKTTTSTIKVTCVAADDPATLALDDGANWDAGSGAPQDRRMKYAGDDDHFLTYKLYVTNGSGACWGGSNVCATAHAEDVTQNASQQTFTVWGALAGSQGLYVGSYADSVAATVNF